MVVSIKNSVQNKRSSRSIYQQTGKGHTSWLFADFFRKNKPLTFSFKHDKIKENNRQDTHQRGIPLKIKTQDKSYEEVMALPHGKHRLPKRPNLFFRTLLKVASSKDLKATAFECRKIGMERLSSHEPCLLLMNHSSFIDLKIAVSLFYPRPLNIVCTSDGFVGKEWFMRQLGCIPTKKFISDVGLVRDMLYALQTLKSSVLMYPEASYSFDGTATPLPDSLGKCLKLLGVPVVMIRTNGAFLRDPLYNNLQLRHTKVTAEMEYLLSPEDLMNKSGEELNEILRQQFSFDHFRTQQQNHVRITEPFRADGLNRVLYKCPHCGTEGQMVGKGITLTCQQCGKAYELTELGYLQALDGDSAFTHIPDWYAWERDCVRKELEDDSYGLDVPVDIMMMVDTKKIYRVGTGRLQHGVDGFTLDGCDGKLSYHQPPQNSYSLYADYFWYEIADVICIGNSRALYYCFPNAKGDVVAKTRLATEELYRLKSRQKGKQKAEV